MTREEAKELLPIIQAYAEGKVIQYKHRGMTIWNDLDIAQFNCDINLYRIKPESEYRPFKTQEECWGEMHKHPDFGWVIRFYNNEYLNIGRIFDSDYNKGYGITLSFDQGLNISFDTMFKDFKFTDGTPFGIKED